MTLFRRIYFVLLWGALQGVAMAQLREAGDGSAGPVKAAHVTAELQAGAAKDAKADPARIALVLQLEPGWHVYWIDAGDSGEPASVQWELPEGVTIGKMQFPVPKRLPLGPLMDYGYEGTAVFPFDFHEENDQLAGDSRRMGTNGHATHLAAHVRWLVCREVCVPGKAFLGLNLPLKTYGKSAESNDVTTAALNAEPVKLPDGDSILVSGN